MRVSDEPPERGTQRRLGFPEGFIRPMAARPRIYRTLLAQQRAWAELRDVDVSDADCTRSTDANLYRPLAVETQEELAQSRRGPRAARTPRERSVRR